MAATDYATGVAVSDVIMNGRPGTADNLVDRSALIGPSAAARPIGTDAWAPSVAMMPRFCRCHQSNWRLLPLAVGAGHQGGPANGQLAVAGWKPFALRRRVGPVCHRLGVLGGARSKRRAASRNRKRTVLPVLAGISGRIGQPCGAPGHVQLRIDPRRYTEQQPYQSAAEGPACPSRGTPSSCQVAVPLAACRQPTGSL